MPLLLDISSIFPALLGAIVGASFVWRMLVRTAEQSAVRLTNKHAEELCRSREALLEQHATEKQALEQRITEVSHSLEVALADIAKLKVEMDRQANTSKDQVHFLEKSNNELTVRLDLANSQLGELRADREHLRHQNSAQLEAMEWRHAEQLQKVESPLTVVVHPFVNTAVEKALFKKTSRVEIGYKYQLMMQGIPCLEPHSFVVETQTQSEVDAEAIKAFGEKALALAEQAAQVKGGGVAGTLISVAKTVVFGRK